MKSLKIGKIRLKNNILLAPMVEVTDAAYREICRKAGAGMAYTEMLNIGAILHENRKTRNLMKKYPGEKPSGIQITGNSIEEFKKAIPYLRGYDLVDINCGCPSIRITGNQSGSYLLRHPSKIGEMIRTLKDAGLTVTAKIRLGFKNNNVMEVAKEVEREGADALTIHARLAFQGGSVPADWKWIAKVKQKAGIPIIGNGDINSGKKAEEMLSIADGAMIARAAIGDPDIFARILYYLKTGKEKEPDFKKNIDYFRKYTELAQKYDIVDIPRIKYLGSNFFRGQHGAAKTRAELMACKSFSDVQKLISLKAKQLDG